MCVSVSVCGARAQAAHLENIKMSFVTNNAESNSQRDLMFFRGIVFCYTFIYFFNTLCERNRVEFTMADVHGDVQLAMELKIDLYGFCYIWFTIAYFKRKTISYELESINCFFGSPETMIQLRNCFRDRDTSDVLK